MTTNRYRADPPIPLLRCPFDEGPGVLEVEIDGRCAMANEAGSVDVYVWCHECGARGPHINEYALDDDDIHALELKASEAWNKALRQPSKSSALITEK